MTLGGETNATYSITRLLINRIITLDTIAFRIARSVRGVERVLAVIGTGGPGIDKLMVGEVLEAFQLWEQSIAYASSFQWWHQAAIIAYETSMLLSPQSVIQRRFLRLAEESFEKCASSLRRSEHAAHLEIRHLDAAHLEVRPSRSSRSSRSASRSVI
eukprot:7152553-Pyramimonas_sp.AAC.1